MTVTQLDALGIAIAAVGEEHLFTFLLSSPMTARTIAVQQGQVEAVKTDLNISLGLAIGLSLLLGMILKSKPVAYFGTAFGAGLYYIYLYRGNLNGANNQ